MSATVVMPQLGETVAEGKILVWFKSVGDEVKVGDKLFEVETDKVTVEVEAVAPGKLTDIRVKTGQTAKVGAVVAVMGGEAIAAAPEKETPAFRPAFEEVATPKENYGPAKGPEGLRISPLARRLAAQNRIDLAPIARDVAARGGVRIREADVKRALATAPPSAPLSAIRRRTAERLTENWRTIPHVFQAIDVEFTQVEVARAKHKEAFRARHGLALTYLPFIARAVCLALRDFQNINATFENGGLQLAKDINLGIAVDLDHQGLVVPVVRNADDLTLQGLTKAIAAQVAKARSGKLTADDFAHGTYSITNNGAFGTLFTSPIINAPQVAILSADAIRKRPVVVETPSGDFVAPRLSGVLGQSFDHRAFDGAYAASFLSRLKQILERRNWLEELENT